jgi:hypothetical protein
MNNSGEGASVSKKVVLTILLGLLSMVFWPAIIPAAVLLLFIVRENQAQPNRRNLWLGGIVVGPVLIGLAAVILYSAWFAVPNLYNGILLRNEVRVLYVVQQLRPALTEFLKRTGGYPATLKEVLPPHFRPTGVNPEIIHGYEFDYLPRNPIGEVRDAGKHYAIFSLSAKPSIFFKGRSSFYLDDAGAIVVRVSREPDAEVSEVVPPPKYWRTVSVGKAGHD